jgi:hypothetical protein
MRALANTERYMRRARATSSARRTLREAAAIISAELRSSPADSIRVRGDTAVDFFGQVGTSVLCVYSGAEVVLLPDVAASGVAYSSWRASPESGDVLSVFDSTGGGSWRTALIDSATTRTDGAGCTPSSGLISVADSAARRPVTRVVLRTSLGAVFAGSPVRVGRSGRYALTRAADGSWSLSYRRCSSGCTVAQPVAGPFAPPSDSGLSFTAIAAESRIEAAMRAPVIDAAAPREASLLRITLRNHAAGVP